MCVVVLAIFGGITADIGWDILEDNEWFCDHIKMCRNRRIIAYIFLATVGVIPIWIFISLGMTLSVIISGYEIIRYGHASDCS
ncbi:MAG: hypothetical protein A2Y82_00440 [Candidatus Buchananbacteria bacterium RBG_13_36_9]|uniref:Uncharacterized protein n=1 Tax=Candidatus Buchananbacteria bacterium RBG_13_36_9 TaxID=1797530 RepID=A0A1G1XRF4_9BACT|nr:MAG: hypothetical protein A2Y82_00440 [Candidatus Buchananbacteria bacterium RBG_13_36_9]